MRYDKTLHVMSSVLCEAISGTDSRVLRAAEIASSQTALTCPALLSGVAMTAE
jgi:hypothetical protein